MNAKRITTLCAAAAAMFSMTAGAAQAQGLFGGYNQSYPVYTAPSTTVWPSGVTNAGYAQPCTTGNCGVRGYTTNYGSVPCATGNCPTSPYVTGYPTANCPTGNCAPGQCTGNCSTQCRTICGPNGCQQICPTGYNSPCGPNGCPPTAGYGNASYGSPMTSAVPTLNLDQAPAWNGNGGYYGNNGMNSSNGFNNRVGFGSVAPSRSSNRPNFSGATAPVNGGYFPASMETNISNDPLVRLN